MKRAAWGTTSPTKPMEPAMLTITAVAMEADMISRACTRRTGTPSAVAESVPKVKASSVLAC